MLLLPERLKRRHRGMQSEKAVEGEHGFLRDVDGRPHGVVTGFAVGHNDIEAVGGAALKDYDESLGTDSGVGSAKARTGQETRKRRRTDYSHQSTPTERDS